MVLALFGASLAASVAAAADLTAAQIADKSIAARGGLQAWRAVNTLTLAGEMDAGGKADVKLPFTMSMKRPHKSRLEIKFEEQTAVQVWDGSQGWKLRPFLNRNEVENYSAAEAKSAATAAELDGPLVDYAKKGTKVELAGTEAVEGKNAYKLKLTLKSGQVMNLWVDATSFLETKIDGEPRKIDGRVHKVTVLYRDYKAEGGLQVAHVLETVVDGVKGSHKMSIQTVKINPPLDDALFTKPAAAAVAQVAAPAASR
jgi:outer membrane lipoprotein-sorting protein